jgi:hypothetical protein
VDKRLDSGMRRSDIGKARKVHEVKINICTKYKVPSTK